MATLKTREQIERYIATLQAELDQERAERQRLEKLLKGKTSDYVLLDGFAGRVANLLGADHRRTAPALRDLEEEIGKLVRASKT